jgi:hypothetical protein
MGHLRKNIFAKCLQVVLLIFACFVICLPAISRPKGKDKDDFRITPGPALKQKRVLTFPRDFSLGEIILTEWPPQKGVPQLRGAARGTVVVPPNTLSRLVPAYHYYKNLNLVDTLPPDGFDSILLAASSLADSEDGLCDKALARVGHLKGLVELDLDRSDATDAGVAYAANLPNLQKISAYSAAIEGQSFKRFAGLKHLRCLRMPRNPVKGENLQYLQAVPQLEYLSLSRCNLNDEGVRYLSKCSKIISLNIADNPGITDGSIKYLLTMKQLKSLMISDTSISVKGILQLKALPHCVIDLPPSKCTAAEYDQLRRAFPQLPPMQKLKTKANTVSPEDKTLFAPLH